MLWLAINLPRPLRRLGTSEPRKPRLPLKKRKLSEAMAKDEEDLAEAQNDVQAAGGGEYNAEEACSTGRQWRFGEWIGRGERREIKRLKHMSWCKTDWKSPGLS